MFKKNWFRVNAVYLDGFYLFYLCQIKPSPECSSLSRLPLVEPETTCVLQDSKHAISLILVIILHILLNNERPVLNNLKITFAVVFGLGSRFCFINRITPSFSKRGCIHQCRINSCHLSGRITATIHWRCMDTKPSP